VANDDQTVSVQQALRLAVNLHRVGELGDAEKLYRRILEAAPDDPDALHYLGVLTHQRGRSDEAVELIRRALAVAPDYPDALSNLGNILREQGRLAEAEACYRGAIGLRPEHSQALLMLGAVLDCQGCDEEATVHLLRAVETVPHDALAFRVLGSALRHAGRLEEAAVLYRRWLASEPDTAEARFLLAACTRAEVPARSPDNYVEGLFDRFAESFDERLAGLSNRAPELVATALARAAGSALAGCAVLDAGCGTGLCATHLRPFAGELTGVDLSAEMLARARERGLYDQLAQAELTGYLAASRERFDLIVSADTLVYFGDLGPVLRAASEALRPGGWLAFTLERADDLDPATGWRLDPCGRYSHAPAYVDATLRAATLTPALAEPVVPRMEAGAPVAGLVVVARRAQS
jgi:predicted TPR repeat methyltransferase